jgi:hypothetical protein
VATDFDFNGGLAKMVAVYDDRREVRQGKSLAEKGKVLISLWLLW